MMARKLKAGGGGAGLPPFELRGDQGVSSTNPRFTATGVEGVTWTLTHDGGTATDVGNNPQFSVSAVGEFVITSDPPNPQLASFEPGGLASYWTHFVWMDLELITDLSNVLDGCANLLEVGPFSVASATRFTSICSNNTSLVSFLIPDMSSGTDFQYAWNNCNLNASSVERILLILDAIDFAQFTNVTTYIGKDGSALTPAAQAASDSLSGKGYSITYQ